MEKTIPLKNIKPNTYNPNEMTSEQFGDLVKEVKHLGKPPKPIILRDKGEFFEIIDGEHSYKALIELGHQELQEGWYEIVDYDDLEAKGQTYKRNLGGTNNPVKLGLMFDKALTDSGMSNRQLAEKWGVSEGTIRTYLLYEEVGKLRSDYANIAKLTNDQIRIYLKIAQYAKPIADYWLYCGGLKDALTILHDNLPFDKANYDVMATFQKLCEQIMKLGFNKTLPGNQHYIPFNLSQKDKEKYINKFKNDFNRAINLSTFLSRMEQNFIWEEKVTREHILEYLVIYYSPPAFINDYWIQKIISTTIRKVGNKFEFLLTPEELYDCMKFEVGKQGLPYILDNIKEILKKKFNIPIYQIQETSEPLEDKLDRLEIENIAPDYIKNSAILPIKYRRAFLDMQFANDEARKEAWEILNKNYQDKDFKNIDLSNTTKVLEKIGFLIASIKQKEQKQKERETLLKKSEQELAELFVEKLRYLTKGDKNFENDLVTRMVNNFTKEYLQLFVWLANKYYDDMQWQARYKSMTEGTRNSIRSTGESRS